ncbi:MAG: hypothetical protein QME74_07420, partial [Candidatus Edwardsbacteria bacterium]|nr:hypothetical protein [Candidatus Edwardsbacteria bacterium]
MNILYDNSDLWLQEYEKKPYPERYDFVADTLGRSLSPIFIDDLDLGGLLLELQDYLEGQREFEKIFHVMELAETHQPDKFQNIVCYFDEFVVDYALFHREHGRMAEPLKRFKKDPVK